LLQHTATDTVQRKPPAERKPLNDTTNTYKGLTPSRSRTSKEKLRNEAGFKPTKKVVTHIQEMIPKEPNEEAVDVDPSFEAITCRTVEENPPLIQQEIDSIILPSSSWRRGDFSVEGCINYFEIQEKEKSVAIQKIASVDFKKRTFSHTILNRDITEIEGKNGGTFTSVAEVEDMLRKLHEARICPGIVNNPEKYPQQNSGLVRNGKLVDGIWRAYK
jgi:hypothetical protein